MTRPHALRTLTVSAAFAAFVLALPAEAHAQRVQLDVKATGDFGRELSDAIREITRGVADAIRDVSRDLGRELGQNLGSNFGRDIGRELGKGLRDLPGIARDLGAFDGGWAMAQDRNWRGKADDRQTRALAIGTSGSIELHNLSGDITVTVSSGRDATVELVRHSRGRTDADARLGLERVKVDTQVAGTRAIIKADYPNDRQAPYSVAIDMIVSAPAGTSVIVKSVSADVKVTGIKGELAITTISGGITLTNVGVVSEAKTASGDVTVSGASTDGTLDVGTLSGDVTLRQVKTRKINASTVSGTVGAHDVICDSATLSTMSGDAVFAGEISRNGRYEITSHSGDVQFSPTGSAGYSLTATSFGGDINSSVALQGDAGNRGRSRQRSLSGKVGDGSATVKLQTFNGDITIGASRRR